MIALIASVLLGLYVLFPDFLFTRLAAQFVQLKKRQRTKFEDIVAGLSVSAPPFVAALLASHLFQLPGHWPFPILESAAAKIADYRLVFSAAYSDAFFNAHQREFWEALNHTRTHQLRFLCWNYFFLAVEILIVVIATMYFGDWRKYRLYRVVFGKTILRRASQWYVLFTGFMFPRNLKPTVMVDVLTTDKHLYDGEVADYFVDASENLSELLLKGFRRFRFAEFEDARKTDKKVRSADYWTKIPGANLVIPYDRVANINIRYVFTEKALSDRAKAVLADLKVHSGEISFIVTHTEDDHPESSLPDLLK